MNKLLIASAALTLLGQGCFLKPSPSIPQPSPAYEQPSAVPPVAPESVKKNAVNLKNQNAGNKVSVESAKFSKRGFVVIHLEEKGKPGKILGASEVQSEGEHFRISIPANIEAGKTYYAMLHADNGDNVFNAAKDLPIKDEDGAIVMTRFAGIGETGQNGNTTQQRVEISAPKTAEVTILNFAFSPSTIKVKKGDKVVFTNKDRIGHTATSDRGTAIDSPFLNQNQSFTLDTSVLDPGSYAYHCTPHPDMKATLIVE